VALAAYAQQVPRPGPCTHWPRTPTQVLNQNVLGDRGFFCNYPGARFDVRTLNPTAQSYQLEVDQQRVKFTPSFSVGNRSGTLSYDILLTIPGSPPTLFTMNHEIWQGEPTVTGRGLARSHLSVRAGPRLPHGGRARATKRQVRSSSGGQQTRATSRAPHHDQ
jgi:hypothetical protein